MPRAYHTRYTRGPLKTQIVSLPYKCASNRCGKTFSTAAGLAIHSRVHTEEESYKCGQCAFASTQKEYLQDHRYRCHETGMSTAVRAAPAPRSSVKTTSEQRPKTTATNNVVAFAPAPIITNEPRSERNVDTSKDEEKKPVIKEEKREKLAEKIEPNAQTIADAMVEQPRKVGEEKIDEVDAESEEIAAEKVSDDTTITEKEPEKLVKETAPEPNKPDEVAVEVKPVEVKEKVEAPKQVKPKVEPKDTEKSAAEKKKAAADSKSDPTKTVIPKR